jgi:hypothetical protein
MGFPEIMYLSKSQGRRLWPELPLSKTQRARFEELTAKASISLTPSVELAGKQGSTEQEQGSTGTGVKSLNRGQIFC